MTDDTPDRLDELLRDAARTYNRAPDEPQMPLQEMWTDVETKVFGGVRPSARRTQWIRIAAALLIGVGIGRISVLVGHSRASSLPAPAVASGGLDSASTRAAIQTAQSLDPATSRYLGQAAALLIALPAEATTPRPDQPFIDRANDLLLTTRLLLDSQAAADPALHALLEDLELVLVQVARLEQDHDRSRRTELELIQQALDQRDVIPRLRTAASEHAADD
jgi:hypothetical protein